MEYVVFVLGVVLFVGVAFFISLYKRTKQNNNCLTSNDDLEIAKLLGNENSGVRVNVYFDDFKKRNEYPHYLGKNNANEKRI